MDVYKPICKHIVIPLWARWESSPYLEILKYLQKSQYLSEEQIAEIQWKKISHLLYHAYNNCPFYKKRFDLQGIHPNDIRSFDDFLNVPILTKQDVYEHRQHLIAPGVDKYKTFLTSGSTGKPLSGYINKQSSEFKRACGMRSQLWSGYDLGERIYHPYGNPEKEMTGLTRVRAKFRRKYLQRVQILDMLELTEQSMLQFADQMRKKPPSLIWGHAHGLYLLASLLESKGIDDIKPKGMYSAGMVLHDFERRKVEEVFHCELQDRYGCEEFGLIASECKKQEGLHINTDSLYVEILTKNGHPVPPGQRGLVTITDLTNLAMPFIRYRMEDIAIPAQMTCSCGRTQPLIKNIEGRIADFLITPDRKLVSGISLTDHFAGHIPGVAQMQIIQNKPDKLTLNIVRDNGFTDMSKEKISYLVKEFFGEKMHYRLTYLDEIPRGPSGKFRFTICEVDNGLI